jgi:hemolysin III
MSTDSTSNARPQTLGEELANAISHGAGVVAASIASPLIILAAVQRGDATAIVATSIFAATVLLLYLSSTLYHAVHVEHIKSVLNVVDHVAIFLLIAGTYTPFTLGVLQGTWGWTLFGAVWGLAILGIGLKLLAGVRYPVMTVVLYLLMGWLVLIALKPLYHAMPLRGIVLLASGGLAYTLGITFYALPKIRYAHFVWHLFVLVGTTCHFVAVWVYAT